MQATNNASTAQSVAMAHSNDMLPLGLCTKQAFARRRYRLLQRMRRSRHAHCKSHAAVNGWRVQAARRAQSVAVVHVQPWRALFSDGHSQPQVGGACAQRHGISAARKLLWLTHSSGVRYRVHAATTVASNDPRASFTTRRGHGRGAPQDLTYWHCLDDEQWRRVRAAAHARRGDN